MAEAIQKYFAHEIIPRLSWYGALRHCATCGNTSDVVMQPFALALPEKMESATPVLEPEMMVLAVQKEVAAATDA